MRTGLHPFCALLVMLMPVPVQVSAQQRDTVPLVELNPLVVTADRVRSPLVDATAAVTRISGDALHNLPARNIADVLRTVPGLVLVDTDGAGFDPQLMVRGFYGGGEAEYMLVLVDGQPVNSVESGLMNWSLIPLEALEAIEVVRGGASSLYGDAALGGVINLITRHDEAAAGRATVTAGGHGHYGATVSLGSRMGSTRLRARVSGRRIDGFRERAMREAVSVSASSTLPVFSGSELVLSTRHQIRDDQQPGPLPAGQLRASRTSVHPFFRFDGLEENSHRLGAELRTAPDARTEARVVLGGELRNVQQVRTLPLSPAFADTKERVLETTRLHGTAVLRRQTHFPADGALTFGGDWSAARMDSRHFGVLMGDSAAYSGSNGGRGELDASGHGTRLSIGAFARYEVRPVAKVRLNIGARLDWIRDVWEPEVAIRETGTLRQRQFALSPQVGLNVRYLDQPAGQGSVFLRFSRSFKAPTPDQLFEQRSIPVPVEPYRVTLANPGLEPQRGTTVEAGVYHAGVAAGGIAFQFSAAAYQADMRDELDVDLETLRYINIGRSRHRGVEAGLRATGPHAIHAFSTYTLQAVTFRNGDHRGNALKAIPRHALSAGLGIGIPAGPAANMTATRVWGIWLDDANTIPLEGYTRVDGTIAHAAGPARIELTVFNVFDSRFSTTGYPDPSGSGLLFYYPSAGRSLQLSLSASW